MPGAKQDIHSATLGILLQADNEAVVRRGSSRARDNRVADERQLSVIVGGGNIEKRFTCAFLIFIPSTPGRLLMTAEEMMNSIRKIPLVLASALAVSFAVAPLASAQGIGYYDHNGYYQNGYDDRYGDRYYGNRYDTDYRGGTIRCESRNQRTVYCRAGFRGGEVRLLNQLSRNACIRGRTWGVSGDRIWVTRGCRGQFRIGDYYGGNDRYRDDRRGYGYGYGNGARTVVCQSRDGRYNFCRGFGYIGQAQIRRQLSNARCQFNYSWGYRNDGVWVDRGCRAEFALY